mgnify:CR=1 FL=1
MKKRTAELILKDPEKFAHHDRVFLNNPVVMQGMGLAPLVVQGIFDIIRTINQQGVTVLLIEQNANMALKVADYAYVLETGCITKSGTGAELLASPEIKRAYLGG